MPLEPKKTTRKAYDKFVRNWKESLQQAYQVANQNIEKAASANKRRYDQKIKHVAVEVGDKVLVRNVTPRGGTGKLRSWWEEKIYEVVEKRDNVPVFKVKPIDGTKVRTVHRNLLLKVDHLPLDTFGQDPRASTDPPEVVVSHNDTGPISVDIPGPITLVTDTTRIVDDLSSAKVVSTTAEDTDLPTARMQKDTQNPNLSVQRNSTDPVIPESDSSSTPWEFLEIVKMRKPTLPNTIHNTQYDYDSLDESVVNLDTGPGSMRLANPVTERVIDSNSENHESDASDDQNI